ncbi:MAG: cytochrome-c peroxidase [Candidatus Cyclobacteriaceae bacterium M3_2C_046]
MNKIILIIGGVAGLLVMISSFRSTSPDEGPMSFIENDFHNNLDQLKLDADAFYHLLQKKPEFDSTLTTAFNDLRQSFKKVEHWMAYLDQEFVNDYLHGAPLPKLERNASSISVIEPKGLQIMEELLYTGTYGENRAKLLDLSRQFNERTREASRRMKVVPLNHRQFFEASRLQLIRIFTLGVTGFDSPAALLSLDEAMTSLSQLNREFGAYQALLNQKDKQLGAEVVDTYQNAIQFIKEHPDFDSFDRLQFLTAYVNPLYDKILQVHTALGVETMYETNPRYTKFSLNYFADNLFDQDFINPYFYTMVPGEELQQPEMIELGQLLFFDPVLSKNNQRSCASCHNPKLAFTDGMAKSLAMDFKGTVQRNAPTLINAVYSDQFFYDLRKGDLENQIDHVVFDHKELNTTYIEIIDKLLSSQEYQQRFRQVFPYMEEDKLINKYTISASITAYVSSLTALDSEFDRYVRGEKVHIDQQVKDGFNLFMGKAACGTCHFAPTFNGLVPPLYRDNETEVLGVPASTDTLAPEIDPDLGRNRGNVTQRADIYKHSFKTMTVRNIEFTAPYMHNGVYQSLEEVVDFYDKGGGIGLGIDVPNQTLPPDPLNLTSYEKESLIAFMKSLNDTTGLTKVPSRLPVFPDSLALNTRSIGGKY